MKKDRDYTHEHELRKKRKGRLIVDIDHDLLREFRAYLSSSDQIYSKWIINKIREATNKGQT